MSACFWRGIKAPSLSGAMAAATVVRAEFVPESALMSGGAQVDSTNGSSALTDPADSGGSTATAGAGTTPGVPGPAAEMSASASEASEASEASASGGLDEALYDELCGKLNMDRPTRDAAWDTVVQLMAENPERVAQATVRDQTLWFVAAMYFAGRVSPGETGAAGDIYTVNGVTVTHLLRAAETDMVVLLDALKALMLLRDSSAAVPAVPEAVREGVLLLQRKFCVLTALHLKFEQAFGQVFATDTCSQGEANALMAFAWTAFVIVKNQYLPGAATTEQLVVLYQLLVCCVHYTACHCAPEMLSAPMQAAGQAAAGPPPLAAVCNALGVQLDETETVASLYWMPYVQSKEGPRSEIAFGPNHLPCNLSGLNKEYEAIYMTHCDIDERLWLARDPQVQTPSRPLAATPTSLSRAALNSSFQGSTAQRRQYVAAAFSVSPSSTPIRSAVASVHQLKAVLAHGSDKPSVALVGFFRRCSVDPTSIIMQEVGEVSRAFKAAYTQTIGEASAPIGAQRCRLGVVLYFRVMEALLNAEADRLGQDNFQTLLLNPTFHRSLLACCLQIVLSTYGVAWGDSAPTSDEEEGSLAFPWLLRAVDVQAYDLHKIIESVVRCEPSLSAQLRRYLGHLEQRIICDLAWERGSPIFAVIARNGGVPASGTATGSSIPPPETNGEHGGSLHHCLSPRRVFRHHASLPARAAFGTETSQHQRTPSKPKSRSLDIFLRKLYRVASLRLKLYCETLGLDERIRLQAWTCFEHSMTQPGSELLLEGRHIDHLLLCAVYAVCKICDGHQLSFRHIVNQYLALPDRQRQTCRDVLIVRGSEQQCRDFDSDIRVVGIKDATGSESEFLFEGRANIIRFYNLVYMPRMKDFICRFSPSNPATEQPPLAEVPHLHADSQSQRLQVPGAGDVYVSPLRRTRHRDGGATGGAPSASPDRRATMTPRTRRLYSFKESPMRSSQELQAFNKSINCKRLRFDQDADDLNPRQRPMYNKFKALAK